MGVAGAPPCPSPTRVGVGPRWKPFGSQEAVMKGMAEHEAGRGAGRMSVAGWAQRSVWARGSSGFPPGPKGILKFLGAHCTEPQGLGESQMGNSQPLGILRVGTVANPAISVFLPRCTPFSLRAWSGRSLSWGPPVSQEPAADRPWGPNVLPNNSRGPPPITPETSGLRVG